MRDAAERALARVEHNRRHKAWCRDELGPALMSVMERIYEERVDREDELFADEQYGKFRARMGPHWRPGNLKMVQKPIQRRVVVIGHSKTTKVDDTPKPRRRTVMDDVELVCEGKPKATVLPKPTLPPPTNDGHDSRILNWMEEIPKPMLGNKQPQGRRLRKIDILAEQEGVPLPCLGGQPQAFRLARRTDWKRLRRDVLREEVLSEVLPNEVLTEEVLTEEESVACRQDLGRRVDEEVSSQATFLTHQDWERRLAGTPLRRQEQQQPVQVEEEEHSTGIIGTIKTWATRVFHKVKMALWG